MTLLLILIFFSICSIHIVPLDTCIDVTILFAFITAVQNIWRKQVKEGRERGKEEGRMDGWAYCSSKFEGARPSWWEGLAAGVWDSYTVSTVRNQRDGCWGSAGCLLCIDPRTPAHPCVFQIQLIHYRNSLTDMPRGLSLMIPNPVKFTININLSQ